MDNRPIGIFDSGVGGLTVVKEIKKLLPNENFIYFGDTARVPYGTKSPETINKYSFQNIRFLLKHNVKAIVIACNTASAVSLYHVQKNFDVPIIGVISAGVKTSVTSTKNKKIGIIGTKATVRSKEYDKQIKKLDENIKTFSTPCSLFVSCAEEGWIDNEIVSMIAKEYLSKLKNENIDTLILGCTHFPLLEKPISNAIGENVQLINPAHETIKELKQILINNNLLREDTKTRECKYFLSDSTPNFRNISKNFLNEEIESFENIDIEQY